MVTSLENLFVNFDSCIQTPVNQIADPFDMDFKTIETNLSDKHEIDCQNILVSAVTTIVMRC
jgi:hypothetical protein